MLNNAKLLKVFFVTLILSAFIVNKGVSIVKSKPKPPKVVTINVSAPASLKDALNEVNALYKKANPHVTIVFNYGASGTLQTQIENGAPCDLFISAASKNMDTLQSKDLIDKNSRKDILKNKLVLITPKDSKKVKQFKDLTSSKVTEVALGEPSAVPAGKYAKDALTYMKLWDKVEPKVVYGSDVRQVLTYVETGNADAGLVYYTDAKISTKVKLVQSAPANSHAPIVYPMATIKNNPHPYTSKDFSNFLLTKKGKDVFVKYGFTYIGK